MQSKTGWRQNPEAYAAFPVYSFPEIPLLPGNSVRRGIPVHQPGTSAPAHGCQSGGVY